MNNNNNFRIKANHRSEETTNINTPHFIENSNIFSSLLEQNVNSHKGLKNINTEIPDKIKDNISMHISKNNANNLSSILAKKKNKVVFNEKEVEGEDNISKKEQKKKIYDYLIPPLQEISIDPVTKIKYIYLEKPNLNNIDNNRNNNIFIHNNSYSSYYSNINNNEIIDYNTIKEEKTISNIHKKFTKMNDINTCSEKINIYKNKSFKDIQNYKQKELKKEKNEDNVINHEVKIYKKKNIRFNDNKNNKINEKHKDININEKYLSEKDKYKSSSLLNDYRKRMIKQFMSYFRRYYYSFIKKYYKLFILNIKKIKHYSKISIPKKYNKKVYKRNIYGNEGAIKDLKSLKVNYSNRNFTTLNSEKSNYINSFNSNKIINEKQISSPFRTINPFLINNNNIDFSTKENLKKKELFRNNFELEKKYTQILNRKRRKKILSNENDMSEDYSSSKNRNENKSIDISHIKNKSYFINKSYEMRNKKNYSPHISEIKNSFNVFSNRELSKDKNIKIDKNKIIKIKSIPRNQKPKIKKNILKIKINGKSNSPTYKRDLSGLHKKEDKKYNFKNKNYIKVNKKYKIISKKEKINSINNSHYHKNFISKTIKNIFTIDKKINIHIKYVFFIPQNIVKKNLKKINKYLQITPDYSYSFFGSGKKSKIYSKKKLTSIKEEEEKSKCSFSIMLNSQTNDEYNSIISYLIETIKRYLIIKMQKSFLYKLKLINLIICIKNINKRNIFKIIKIIINKEDKKDNNCSNQDPKLNVSNSDFLVDDKIIINPNIMNNSH